MRAVILTVIAACVRCYGSETFTLLFASEGRLREFTVCKASYSSHASCKV